VKRGDQKNSLSYNALPQKGNTLIFQEREYFFAQRTGCKIFSVAKITEMDSWQTGYPFL
jgi:hypothetical protein